MNSAYTARPTIYDKVSTVKNSKRAYEESAYYGGLGLMTEKPEGENISYDDFIQGPTKRWTHKTYGLGVRITEEAIEDCLYDSVPTEMTDMVKELGRVGKETLEVLVNDMYNSGVSTATTPRLAGDGVAVFSASHLLLNGGTWSNLASASAAIGTTSMQTALAAFENTVDDRGLQQVLVPKYLMVPPAIEGKARELLQSTYTPGDANNSINWIKASRGLELVVNPYLTSTTAWYLIAEQNPIITFMRRKPAFAQDGDFDSGDMRFKGTMRMSVEVNKPLGIYRNNGA
jgi:phage major head subunit gpT-like protein